MSTPDLAAPASIFNTTGQANCPTGTVPWGGGASLTNGFAVPGTSLNTSEPVTGGWRARVNNASGTAQTFRVDVICAKKPKGYKVAFQSSDNPPHDNTPATVTCPTGTVVLSGGAFSTSDTTAEAVTTLGPLGSHRHTASMDNTSNVDQQFIRRDHAHRPGDLRRIAADVPPAVPSSHRRRRARPAGGSSSSSRLPNGSCV